MLPTFACYLHSHVTYIRMFGSFHHVRLPIVEYIKHADIFHSIGGPSTRLPSVQRHYSDLLAVCLCYAVVARRTRTPVKLRLRLKYSITGAVPHFERTQVRIRGRWRTRTQTRPQVLGHVTRARLEVQIPEEREHEFNNIVRGMLADPRFRGNPDDFLLNEVI
jgi:hypothetical protein